MGIVVQVGMIKCVDMVDSGKVSEGQAKCGSCFLGNIDQVSEIMGTVVSWE